VNDGSKENICIHMIKSIPFQTINADLWMSRH